MQNLTTIWRHDGVITEWQIKECCIRDYMDLRYEEKDEGEDNHLNELKVTELIGWKLWSCVHTDVFCLVFCNSSRKRQAFEISFTKRIHCFFMFSFTCFFCFYHSFLFIYVFIYIFGDLQILPLETGECEQDEQKTTTNGTVFKALRLTSSLAKLTI